MNCKGTLLLITLLTCFNINATNIVITYIDEPNVGFNDPTTRKATSDNPATTLGEARKYILETTVELFSTQIKTDSDIFWAVEYSELGGGFGAITLGPVSTEFASFDTPDPFGILEIGRSYPFLFSHALKGTANTFDFSDDYDATTVFSELYPNLTFSLIEGQPRLSSTILHELVHVIGFSNADCLGNCLPAPASRKNQFSKYVYVSDNINGQWDNLSIEEKERVGVLENQVTFKGRNSLFSYGQNNLTSGFNEHGVELHSTSNDDGTYDNQSIGHLSANVQPEQLMHSAGKDVMQLGISAHILCDMGWCRDTGFVTDLSISYESSTTLLANTESPLTFEIVNLGGKTVNNAIVELIFPMSTVINESALQDNCSLLNTMVTCTYDELYPSDYLDITVQATITDLAVYSLKGKIYSDTYVVDLNGMNNLSIKPLTVQVRDFPTITINETYNVNSEATVNIIPTFSAQEHDNLTFEWTTDEDIVFTQDNATGELAFTAPKVTSVKSLTFSLITISNGRTTEQSITIKVNPPAAIVQAADESSPGGGMINLLSLFSMLLLITFKKAK